MNFSQTIQISVDAIVISAEAGSAWTILHPAYSVVVPEPHIKAHAALAMPLDDSDFEDFVNDWLEMKKTSGIIDKLYEKWILGKKVEKKSSDGQLGVTFLVCGNKLSRKL